MSVSSSLPSSHNLTSQQREMDALDHQFMEEACNWRNTLSMMAGGLAYRFGKAAVLANDAIAPLAGKVLAPLVGLFTEVSAYRGSQILLNNASLSSVFSREEFLGTYLNFANLKLFGKLGSSHLFLNHFIQDTGMVAGEHLSYALHLTLAPEGSLTQQYLHAEMTNTAMGVGMSLGELVTGGISARETKAMESLVQGPELSKQDFVFEETMQRGLKVFASPRDEFDFKDPAERQHWLDTWKPRFPDLPYRDNYVQEIIETALETPFEKMGHYTSLLEICSRMPQAGTLEQLHVLRGIQEVFTTEADKTPTGGFDRMLLHELLSRGISEAPQLRQERLGKILEAMRQGITRAEIYKLFDEFSYSNRLSLQDLRDFIKNSTLVVQALRGGRYEAKDIYKVLAYALRSPAGMLVFRRACQIFAVEDSPYKLKEITEGDHSEDKLGSIAWMVNNGIDPQLVAHLMNGSSATAFIHDERLARKVVSVMMDVEESLKNPHKVEEAKRRVLDNVFAFLESGRPFTEEEMILLLEANTTPHIESLKRAWHSHAFQILIVDEAEFQEMASSLHAPSDCGVAFFVPRTEIEDLIVIKNIPRPNMQTHEGISRARDEVVMRLQALIHEWEHWKHRTGNYDEMEVGADPVIYSLDRHSRIVSEMMAYLEEERWTMTHYELSTWRDAARIGENLPMFLRNRADRSYYLGVNKRILGRT